MRLTETDRKGASGAERATALAWLAKFEQSYLPSTLRRLAQWKGLDLRRHADFLDDLRQELALDCLEHATEVASLDESARNKRWFRLVHLVHYRLRSRSQRVVATIEEIDRIADPRDRTVELTDVEPEADSILRDVERAAVHLRNGKLNAEATAARLGLRRRSFRSVWQDCAARLGFGPEFVAFWRRRLLEALLAHACDLLRARGAVAIVREHEIPRADPAASRRRLERIRARLSSHPAPRDIKRSLALLAHGTRDAARILLAARELAPREPAVALWQFECAVAVADLRLAANRLRTVACDPRTRVPTILARARLLEARGQIDRARHMLERADSRRPDPRLSRNAERLTTPTPPARRMAASHPAHCLASVTDRRRSERTSTA